MAPRKRLKPGEGQQELPFGASGPSATDRFRQLYGNVGYSNAGIGRPMAGPGFISESENDPPAQAAKPSIPGFNTGTGPLPNLRMGSSTPFRGPELRPGGPRKNDAFVDSLGSLPNNGAPAPSSNYQMGNPAPPVSANPMPPGYSQAPPLRQQVGRMAQAAVNQYQLSKVPGTPQAAAVEGAASFAKWSVRPATHNLDTMMQRNWSSESKNLVYGRGISEPGPHDIETDNMRLPSYSEAKAKEGDPVEQQKAAAQQQHSNPHPTTGHGIHLHDENAFYPLRSAGGPPGAPPMLQGAGTPPRPMSPAGGASRTQDFLFEGNRAGVGANPWFNQHDQLVSGINVRPVQSIGATKEY